MALRLELGTICLVGCRACSPGLTILFLDLEGEISDSPASLERLIAHREVAVLVDLVYSYLDHPLLEIGCQLVFVLADLELFAQPLEVEGTVANLPMLG